MNQSLKQAVKRVFDVRDFDEIIEDFCSKHCNERLFGQGWYIDYEIVNESRIRIKYGYGIDMENYYFLDID